MDPAPPTLGVPAASAVPPAEWPPAGQGVAPPKEGSAAGPPPPEPPAWPRSPQCALALLLALAAGLLAWHAYRGSRRAARPTALEPGALTYRVDLNRADRAQLLQLPGVGKATADRIEAYRLAHGGFQSVDELLWVGGVGPVLLERLRPLVCVETTEGAGEAGPAGPPTRVPVAPVTRGKKPELTGAVDINRAKPEELQRLPGIGPRMSERIVATRAKGPFRSADELRRVPGIGAKTLERLRPYVTVDGRAPAEGD